MSDAQRYPHRLESDQAKSAPAAPPASGERKPWPAGSEGEAVPHRTGVESALSSTLASPLIALIRGYQRWVSPGRPPTCRFYPSCSEYAAEALRTHGLFEGSALALWRVLRCAPWHPGGVDPVPPRRPRVVRRTDDPATEERGPC